MTPKHFTKDHWYSVRYESGFSIIFQVVDPDGENFTLRRKDGVIVNSIPSGYEEIISYGVVEPEYEYL